MESLADQHRLSAIMFTDIVGYTRKMGDDEVKMLRLLRDHDRIVRAAIEEQHGDVIKGTGDGFLIRFDGATNAVLCAIAINVSPISQLS